MCHDPAKFDEVQHLPAVPLVERTRERERERGRERDRKSAVFRNVHRAENEVNGIYKRGSGHRGRNPNLITSGPAAVDSIFKMTGGRDGCDVTLRRRLKPY